MFFARSSMGITCMGLSFSVAVCLQSSKSKLQRYVLRVHALVCGHVVSPCMDKFRHLAYNMHACMQAAVHAMTNLAAAAS